MNEKLRRLGARDGFSLIEMLVAMAIFVLFTGLILNSYLGVVRGLRVAEEYRVLYSEARHSFEVMTDLARNSRYYNEDGVQDGGVCSDAADEFSFYAKDGSKRSTVCYSGAAEKLYIHEKVSGEVFSEYDLHAENVFVKDFEVYVTPSENPYGKDYNFSLGTYFHPKVTLVVIFARENAQGVVNEVKLQTSVSSRVYN